MSTESKVNAEPVRWPSAEWHATFHAQATAKLLDVTTRCAAIEIARLGHHHVDIEQGAEDLVQGVLAATCAGTRTWHPEVVPLMRHVQESIRHACRHAYHRQRAGNRPSLIALDGLQAEDGLWTEVEDALAAQRAEPDHNVTALARRLMAQLVERLDGDDDAISVLAAMAAGTTGNIGLSEVTGLDGTTIHNAVRRIRSVGRRVSPDLIAGGEAALGAQPEAPPGRAVSRARITRRNAHRAASAASSARPKKPAAGRASR